MPVSEKLAIVVLISGSGSNLQSIIDAQNSGINIDIRAVISNREDAYGLVRAKKAGIATVVLDHNGYADRDAYDAALKETIDQFEPGLVILAGFMRILTPGFVEHYIGKMMNIHPSLLPKYRGLNTHKRAIEAGDKEAGCTVHFVTPELDSGPIINQAKVEVLATDTPEDLAKRVLEYEHRLYPQAIGWFAEGRLSLNNEGITLLDGQPIE